MALEIIFTIGVFALWLLFPIGVFISVAFVDRNTDQIPRFIKLQQDSRLRGAAKQRISGKRREFIPLLRPGIRH